MIIYNGVHALAYPRDVLGSTKRFGPKRRDVAIWEERHPDRSWSFERLRQSICNNVEPGAHGVKTQTFFWTQTVSSTNVMELVPSVSLSAVYSRMLERAKIKEASKQKKQGTMAKEKKSVLGIKGARKGDGKVAAIENGDSSADGGDTSASLASSSSSSSSALPAAQLSVSATPRVSRPSASSDDDEVIAMDEARRAKRAIVGGESGPGKRARSVVPRYRHGA